MSTITGRLMSVEVLARVPGLTYRQLDYWTRRGFLLCEVPTPGSGYQRKFAPLEVDVAKCLMVLSSVLGELADAQTAPLMLLSQHVRRSLVHGVPIEIVPGVSIDAQKML